MTYETANPKTNPRRRPNFHEREKIKVHNQEPTPFWDEYSSFLSSPKKVEKRSKTFSLLPFVCLSTFLVSFSYPPPIPLTHQEREEKKKDEAKKTERQKRAPKAKAQREIISHCFPHLPSFTSDTAKLILFYVFSDPLSLT